MMSRKYEFDCRIDFLCFSLVVVSVIVGKLIDIFGGGEYEEGENKMLYLRHHFQIFNDLCGSW